MAAAVLVADLVTKQLAVDHLSGRPLHLVGPVSLQLAYNTGVAFSLGAHEAWPAAVAAAALVAVVLWVGRSLRTAGSAVALGLVVGGALGNLADRFAGPHGGAVVDFVHLGFWPTFNLADAAIVVGCALLLLRAWRRRPARHLEPSGDAEPGEPASNAEPEPAPNGQPEPAPNGQPSRQRRQDAVTPPGRAGAGERR